MLKNLPGKGGGAAVGVGGGSGVAGFGVGGADSTEIVFKALLCFNDKYVSDMLIIMLLINNSEKLLYIL